MTRLEAEDRAWRIWGDDAVVSGPSRMNAKWQTVGETQWYVAVASDQLSHAMDANGHTVCHERCAALEAAIGKPKHPKNVAAIIAWYEKNVPQRAALVASLFAENRPGSREETLVALVLQGFEAGRVFEREHPDVVAGVGYLED